MPDLEVILHEDDVIDAVISYLLNRRWSIVSRFHADEQGPDVVAPREGKRLIIEAKGAGSSKRTTSRYGQPFTRGQVFDHVAKAVLKAVSDNN